MIIIKSERAQYLTSAPEIGNFKVGTAIVSDPDRYGYIGRY